MSVEEAQGTCSNWYCLSGFRLIWYIPYFRNSKIQLGEDKLALHEAYCIRHNTICPLCNEAVHKLEMDSHMKESHKKPRCPHCSFECTEEEMKVHLILCELAPKTCDYCKLKVECDDFDNHVYICGSRTTDCLYCGEIIRLNQVDKHQLQCAKAFGQGTESESQMTQWNRKEQKGRMHQEAPKEFAPITNMDDFYSKNSKESNQAQNGKIAKSKRVEWNLAVFGK